MPRICLLCNKPSPKELCLTCAQSICLRPSYCSAPISMHSLVALSGYHELETVKKMLHHLKFEGNFRIGEYLSDHIKQVTLPFPNKIDYWIPVPIHKKRQKQRGFNQVILLFEKTMHELDIPCLPCLERHLDTPPLYDLDPKQRQAILSGAFVLNSLKSKLPGKRVLLCDDIVTTGSTYNEISTLLKSIEDIEIDGLTLAYTQHKGLQK